MLDFSKNILKDFNYSPLVQTFFKSIKVGKWVV